MGKLKKICNIITTVLLSAILLIAFLLVGVRIFNVKPYTVLSGSMEPNYHVGSIVYVKEVDPFDLKEKDVITYVIGGGTVVTHRIVEVIYDNEENPTQVSFRTKGDNNNTEDGGEPIPARQVLGKVVFTIPLLGYVANFVQNPPGRVLTLGICGSLALLFFLPDILDKILKEEKEDKDENESEADKDGEGEDGACGNSTESPPENQLENPTDETVPTDNSDDLKKSDTSVENF